MAGSICKARCIVAGRFSNGKLGERDQIKKGSRCSSGEGPNKLLDPLMCYDCHYEYRVHDLLMEGMYAVGQWHHCQFCPLCSFSYTRFSIVRCSHTSHAECPAVILSQRHQETRLAAKTRLSAVDRTRETRQGPRFDTTTYPVVSPCPKQPRGACCGWLLTGGLFKQDALPGQELRTIGCEERAGERDWLVLLLSFVCTPDLLSPRRSII